MNTNMNTKYTPKRISAVIVSNTYWINAREFSFFLPVDIKEQYITAINQQNEKEVMKLLEMHLSKKWDIIKDTILIDNLYLGSNPNCQWPLGEIIVEVEISTHCINPTITIHPLLKHLSQLTRINAIKDNQTQILIKYN